MGCVLEEANNLRHRAAVEVALRRLLERESDDAFVIVEHAPTGKFVQFVGSSTQPLLLDLPLQPLVSVEVRRAAALFEELGVQLESWPVLDQPEGSVVGTQSGLQVAFERQEVAQAAALALRVFTEVYKLPADFPLSIEEN